MFTVAITYVACVNNVIFKNMLMLLVFRPIVDDLLRPWVERAQQSTHHKASWSAHEWAVINLMDGWGVPLSRPAVPTFFSKNPQYQLTRRSTQAVVLKLKEVAQSRSKDKE